MKINANILAELKEVAPALATFNKATPYAIPENYFTTLSELILSNIRIETIAKVDMPYTVPANYFNNLSNDILASIANEHLHHSNVEQELKVIAPLLNTINKKTVYTVPNNYFETVNIKTSSLKPQAKVVAFKTFRQKMAYLTAACVIGFIAIGTFVFTNKTDKIDYAAYKQIDVNTSINKISNEELLNYLESVNSITNSNALSTIDVKLPDIQDHIQTIPEEELQQYLKEVDIPSREEYQLGI